MFRVWGKIMKENRLVKDTVIEIDDYEMSCTKRVYKALEDMCYEFDLAVPIWLKKIRRISSATQGPDLPLITLSIPLISIIWIFM